MSRFRLRISNEVRRFGWLSTAAGIVAVVVLVFTLTPNEADAGRAFRFGLRSTF